MALAYDVSPVHSVRGSLPTLTHLTIACGVRPVIRDTAVTPPHVFTAALR